MFLNQKRTAPAFKVGVRQLRILSSNMLITHWGLWLEWLWLSPDWRGLKGLIYGAIAQLGEHLLCTQGVVGSNPSSSTNSSVGVLVSGRSGGNKTHSQGL